MENRKIITVILFLTLAFLPAFVFAYEPTTTHKALTDDIVDFYNHAYSARKITASEKLLIKQGSVEEDHPSERVLNHFYDPVRNVGFKSVNNTSKAWAMNPYLQSNNDQVAGVGGLLLDTFTSPADFSWERAIFDYAYKDKDRGLLALGHVLHLLEDATVPDHVRDDAHPPAFSLGSPYEAYTNQYTESNIKTATQLISEQKKPIEIGSIGDYFDTVASFTNRNFFSKDTIFDEKYVEPIINYEKKEYGDDGQPIIFGYSDKVETHRLMRIVKIRDENNGTINSFYFLTDSKNLILSDYWNILSRYAVQNGAGVIKLFFDEVEKEKKSGILLAKNKSNWAKLIDKFDQKINSFFSPNTTNTFDSATANIAGVGALANSQTPTTPTGSSATLASSPVTQTQTNFQTSPSQITTNPTQTNTANPANTNPSITNTKPPQPTSIPTLPIGLSIAPGFGGGSVVTPSIETAIINTESVATPTPTPTYFLGTTTIAVLSPLSGNQIAGTTTVIFSGTSTPFSIISLDLASATTTVDTTGLWQLSLTLSQGTTTLIFSSSTSTLATSSTSISVFIDATAPTVSFSIPACSQSLALDGCLLATTTVSIEPTSLSTDLNYFTLNIDGIYSTTTTATTTNLANDRSHTIAISAVDFSGNHSATTSQTLFTSTFPVVINEVAWAGTQASSTGEWIELYNKTPFSISLTGWTLYAESHKPYIPLSGTIASKSFYLLERRDDTVVQTVSADQVYGNGGSAWALGNGGDRMILSYASTTIDQTALSFETSDTGSWPGGENLSEQKISMERYDPFVSGDDEFNWDNNLELIKNGSDTAEGIIYGTPRAKNSLAYLINKNQDFEDDFTLTAENSPYLVVDNFIDIPAGKTLTIEPNVVVKFKDGGFDFLGGLLSQGTRALPVVFTSFADDDYGGDLNGDATTTVPTSHDWAGVGFFSEASRSVIDGLKLLHSGGLLGMDTYLSGSDTEFRDNTDTIDIYNSTLSLTRSRFEDTGNQALRFSQSLVTLTDFSFISTTTTQVMIGARNQSHLAIDGFFVDASLGGGGVTVYSNSSVTLRNGTLSGIGNSEIFVLDQSTADIDSVIFDGLNNMQYMVMVANHSHATTTRSTFNNTTVAAVAVFGDGLGSIDSSTVFVASTTFRNNQYGVYLDNGAYGRIESSDIVGGQYGVMSDGAMVDVVNSSISSTTAGAIYNMTPGVPIFANNNWWGDPSGPQHPTLNSGGLGGVVSDGVDFEPWLTADPFQ